MSYGSIQNLDVLKKNLKDHCIPESVFEMTIDDYPLFLEERRKLMAAKVERYYKKL